MFCSVYHLNSWNIGRSLRCVEERNHRITFKGCLIECASFCVLFFLHWMDFCVERAMVEHTKKKKPNRIHRVRCFSFMHSTIKWNQSKWTDGKVALVMFTLLKFVVNGVCFVILFISSIENSLGSSMLHISPEREKQQQACIYIAIAMRFVLLSCRSPRSITKWGSYCCV